MTNDEGDQFIGYIDLIAEWEDGRTVVFDNKTTSKKYEENSAKESKQLATYLATEKYEYIGFIVIEKKIRKNTPKVRIQVIIDKVDDSLIESVYEDYDRVNTLIKRGEFPQNFNSCESVYGKCQFFNICRSGDFEGLIDVSKEKK